MLQYKSSISKQNERSTPLVLIKKRAKILKVKSAFLFSIKEFVPNRKKKTNIQNFLTRILLKCIIDIRFLRQKGALPND